MREIISIESRIAMSLQRLGTGNILCNVGEAHGLAKNMTLEIVRNFYRLARVHLQRTFVQFLNLVRLGFQLKNLRFFMEFLTL